MLKALFSRPLRLFYGWWIVVTGCVINAVGGGVYLYGFSVFFLPVSRDLGINRTMTSLVVSLSRGEGAVMGPWTGWLIDRFGPRAMILWGAALAGVGFILLAQTQGFLAFLLIYIGLVSFGNHLGFGGPILASINSWFVRRRGLTMSIVLSAFMAGGAVITPLLAWVVSQWGWRWASILSGIAILAIILPASLLVRRSPESMGLLPDGDMVGQVRTAGTRASAASSVDFGVKEAMATRAFWILATASTLRMAIVGSIIVHFVPLMVWKGASEQWGAFLMGAMALAGIPGRVFLGWVGDLRSKRYVVALGMILGVLAMLSLLYAQATWQLWVFVVLFALLLTVTPLNWALIGDFFGRKNFATIEGIMSLFYGLGSMLFPVFAGAIYDRTGSYDFVVWTFVALAAAASVLFAMLRPPVKKNGP